MAVRTLEVEDSNDRVVPQARQELRRVADVGRPNGIRISKTVRTPRGETFLVPMPGILPAGDHVSVHVPGEIHLRSPDDGPFDAYGAMLRRRERGDNPGSPSGSGGGSQRTTDSFRSHLLTEVYRLSYGGRLARALEDSTVRRVLFWFVSEEERSISEHADEARDRAVQCVQGQGPNDLRVLGR
jgi:hypothetical protein